MALAACSDDEGVTTESVNQKTLLVFMPWTGDKAGSSGLYPYFEANLDSMESAIIDAKGLGQKRVLVFLSSAPESSTLYELKYERGACTRTTLLEYEGHDYTTTEGLTSLFGTVAQLAPALNYALVVGSHGTGWTRKADWEDYPNRARRRASAAPATRFYGSVADSSYATDVSTLARGIEASGLKMQFILFDDCYMANVETAYELRNATNFLVASTSEIMAVGMPYRTMWPQLISVTPSYSSITSAFNTFFSHYAYPFGTLSAIDCRQVEALAQVMRDINAGYSLADSLRDSVQVLDGFRTPIFFDMSDYVARLGVSPRLQDRYATQLAKVVRSSVTTDSVYSSLYGVGRYLKIRTNCGLTISDPSRNGVALKGMASTAWWKATHE